MAKFLHSLDECYFALFHHLPDVDSILIIYCLQAMACVSTVLCTLRKTIMLTCLYNDFFLIPESHQHAIHYTRSCATDRQLLIKWHAQACTRVSRFQSECRCVSNLSDKQTKLQLPEENLDILTSAWFDFNSADDGGICSTGWLGQHSSGDDKNSGPHHQNWSCAITDVAVLHDAMSAGFYFVGT